MLIKAEDFYGNYHGHTIEHLELLAKALHITPPAPDGALGTARPRVIWLAGDSSLDNKAWIREVSNLIKYPNFVSTIDETFTQGRKTQLTFNSLKEPTSLPLNGYEKILKGGCVQDVAYLMNRIATAQVCNQHLLNVIMSLRYHSFIERRQTNFFVFVCL